MKMRTTRYQEVTFKILQMTSKTTTKTLNRNQKLEAQQTAREIQVDQPGLPCLLAQLPISQSGQKHM